MRITLLPLLLTALSPLTHAHDLFLSGLNIEVKAQSTTITVTARKQFLNNGDAAQQINERLRVLADGVRLRPTGMSVKTDDEHGMLQWTATTDAKPTAITVLSPLFPDVPTDRTVVTFLRYDIAVGNAILNPDSKPITLGEAKNETTAIIIGRFLGEGVRHILGGIDHLAFLLALLLPVQRIKSLVKIVTCFTLAHSITLTLAVLGFVDLSPSLVEPVIAISIVIAAAENFRTAKTDTNLRMLFAFVFGLIHGFGFAGALAETGLPKQALGFALAAFNGGVELGQLAVVLIAAPILMLLEKRSTALRAAIVRYTSIMIIAAGLMWTFQRVTN